MSEGVNTERWQRVKEIVDAALEHDSAERSAFLDRVCAEDEAIRGEVESLLASYEDDPDFMETPAASVGGLVGRRPALPAGEHLGRFEVISLVGEGGMGEVYLAHDPSLGRKIALKLLPSHFTDDAGRVRRFEREARAASALNHPNILTIHEIGCVNGRHFIATEFIEGETLRGVLEREVKLRLFEALDVSAQIASALAAAHEAGVMHRDIKPENVIIRRDRLVKVLDFGLAKFTSPRIEKQVALSSNVQSTLPGVVMGTATYMSPEQARGLEVDARTDIFSLGVVLYEMVTGRLPFAGETTSDVIAAILTAEPAPPDDLGQKVPVEIKRIIGKSLTKDRAERYQTATDLLADLQRLQQRLEVETEDGSGFGAVEADPAPLDHAAEEADAKAVGAFAPPDVSRPPNNLSQQITPLIGREQEMAEAAALLKRDDVRLVTMTGVGGTGKTLLARWVARGLLGSFRDGLFLVELAALTNAELVVSTIAQTLGVTEAGGRPIIELLKDYLREREVLLVLDNFEQVIEAAPRLAELLVTAPGLTILITSRVLLRLSTERELFVPPLAVPAKITGVSAAELSVYAAARLFVRRAREVKPNFALTDENAGSVAEICARLDGLPLALELAAARVRLLTPRALLARLEHRLKFLTGGARDLPARQQTVRGAIAWSYDLLTAEERLLFRRLAAFAGGFTLEAAEAVCADGGSGANQSATRNPQSAIDVLDGLTSLVDKSLLVQKERADGAVRLRMLEVVREYALEALESSGEAEHARRGHAAYFLALGEEAEPHLQSGQSSEWLDRLEEEHDNLRAAMQWSLERDVETAARLAGAIRTFWTVRGHLTEGGSRLRAALERAGRGVPQTVRFKLLNGLGPLARLQGDYETARKVYEEGLAGGRAANDLRQVALASWGLGAVAEQQCDITAARKYIEDGLAISRELDDKFGIAVSLSFLGDLARTEGEAAAARPLFEESLVLFRQLGNKRAVSNNLNNLGAVACGEGDYRSARLRFSEALATAQELGHIVTTSYSLDGFAALAARCDEPERAARLAGAAEHLRESIGSEMEPAERRFRDAYLAEIRTLLTESAFRSAYEQGRKLRLEEAVALGASEAANGDRNKQEGGDTIECKYRGDVFGGVG